MSTLYDTDIVAWADEQAALLRAGRFHVLDIEHIADEVSDVGKSEQRELANRMTVLLIHLLKWRYQPGRQGKSWQRTIREQRRALAIQLKGVPSLKPRLRDSDWMALVWADSVARAAEETGLEDFPFDCPWSEAEILDPEFYPA